MHRLDSIAAKLVRLGSEAAKASDDDAADGPRAAVAAILRQEASGDSAELFFIRRAESPSDPWSGHIAFPGGRRDPGDESLLATAIRETREEVGIDLGRAELLARLPDVPAFIRSKRGVLVVTPFVFAMRDPIVEVPNREVASTLWVPVAKLARGEGKGTYAFTWEEKPYELPCIRLRDLQERVPCESQGLEPDQHVLWGMTYRMMETMLEAIA